MEWVETRGRTVEEAKDMALDQLGVDESDAEFEVLDEPKAGLFGRVRREARVRARIRPTVPRPKNDRRRRSPGRPRGERNGGGQARGGKDRGGEAGRSQRSRNQRSGTGKASTERENSTGKTKARDDAAAPAATADRPDQGTGGSSTGSSRRRRGRGSGNGAKRTDGRPNGKQGDEAMGDTVSLEEQAEIVEDFLDGLVDAFDLDGEVRSERVDDDTLEVRVEGDDLGLLIGPKGQTLAAVQELARTIVQRKSQGSSEGRLRIDVAGYRQRRREALERFTREIAEEVKRTGNQKALEPMGSADRKVVHDTVNEMDGVKTTSEGEEPRRRVVILPET